MARNLFFVTLFVLSVVLVPTRVRADEIAPELETLELRQKAHGEMRRMFSALAERDRRRLVGTYLAIDPSATELVAQAACDDDGDYVVVVSDAMLRLVANVARAQSYDEDPSTTNDQHVEDYASYLARAQVPGSRILPPLPGFYAGSKAAPTAEDRLREALAFVIARELAVLRAGELSCPHPTATKEHGDDTWSEAEQKTARAIARRLYPNPNGAAAHDDEAIRAMLDAGRGGEGAIGLLRFFARLEIEPRRFASAYVTMHPGNTARVTAMRAALQRWRAP